VWIFSGFHLWSIQTIFVLLFKERTQKNLKLLKLQCSTLLEAFKTLKTLICFNSVWNTLLHVWIRNFHLAATNTFSHTSFSFSIFIHLLQTLYFWVEFVLQSEWWKKNIRTRTWQLHKNSETNFPIFFLVTNGKKCLTQVLSD